MIDNNDEKKLDQGNPNIRHLYDNVDLLKEDGRFYVLMGEEKLTSDEITEQAVELAVKAGFVKTGDTVVILSSNKTVPTSSTDSLNIRIV